jgi:CRISPR-associated protein Cmr6
MSSTNIGWLFYKDYFKGINYSDLADSKNEDIVNKKLLNIIAQSPKIEESQALGNVYFNATTTYPGLLLGSGNAHELPDIKGQAILGFHFDYTSGLPLIQGSSVKGVLRSAFKHEQYIEELVSHKSINIKALEKEIFDNGDIFFDATITKALGRILGDDYITPHKEQLKNPIPLRFIKVMPNVTFKFDFWLHEGMLSIDEKAILFAQILSDLGIGAKTNVGYGKFSGDLVAKTKLLLVSQKEDVLKIAKEKEDALEKLQEEQLLNSLDSSVEKIKAKIKTLQDRKLIYDVIIEFSLDAQEIVELLHVIKEKIGPKPEPKNKAEVKWAIKIYELLEK